MTVPNSIDMDNIYICGLTQIKDFYVICQFELPKFLSQSDPQILVDLLTNKKKNPSTVPKEGSD